MVVTGAEDNILPSGLFHSLNSCLTAVVLKVWNLYALQTVGKAVCSVLYKDIALIAKFYIVKGAAAYAAPLLSYDLCVQLVIMHEVAQDTSGVIILAKIEGDMQSIIQRHHDLFSGDGVLSTGYASSLQFDLNKEVSTTCTLHTFCTCGEDPSRI